MYCPECGNDAEDAKFCPECGADLRDLAQSPACGACGSEVPEGAKFCPECGDATGAAPVDDQEAAETAEEAEAAGAAGVAAAGGRRTGERGRNAGVSRQQQRQQQRRQQSRAQKSRPQAESRQAAAGQSPRVSPALIWGGFGLLAVVVILVVVFVAGGGGDSPEAAAPTGGTQSVQPVSADTSGSYDELVQRANGLYDEGAAAVQAEEFDQGAAYFAAAAKVYAAAWQKQSTEPGVGTDFATSLFYSGKIEPALRQIERVLAQSPSFQTAWFNKGNYLMERARLAEQDGDAKVAEASTADARVAFEKAVSLGADTSSGQQAQQRLDELPQ